MVIPRCHPLALMIMALLLGWNPAHGDLTQDFEQPESTLRQQGWRIGPNARITPATEGQSQSLHIQVDDPGKQRKYAEYLIPVNPGEFYQAQVRIRTQGVARHLNGGYNRGAVIFLQLLDKQKKHMTGGSFPRGLRGDQDWQTQRIITTNRMPAGAAYIQVMIGIEGQGEAWFDDLSVTRITADNFAGVTVDSPTQDKPSDKLRPVFHIREGTSDVSKFGCRVELSQDASFPANATITEELTHTPYQLSYWLTPGRWHYRIIHFSSGVALPPPPAQSFVIADDATAWPPVIKPDWQWSQDPRPTLRAKVDHPQRNTLTFAITIHGKPAKILGMQGDHVVFTPTQDLAPGGHPVRIEATHEGQSLVVERLFANQAPGSRITFRPDRVMLIDGQPFYPLGTYRDPSDSIQSFDGVVQAGFNLTHDYLFEHGPQDVAVARAYLDAAHERGLKVFMGIPRSKIKDQDYLWIETWVAGLMDHPALLLWYLMDEPELQGVTADALRHVRHVVRSIDPFHPTTVVYCQPGRFHEWQGSHDLQWHDPYPLPNRPLTWVEKYVRSARQAQGDQGPAWTVLQGFDYRYARNRERYHAIDKFGQPDQPSREQTRAMAFLALANGSDGLVWYWLPRSAYHIVQDAPATWQGIVHTTGLMRKLEPWLLASPTADDQAIKAGASFRIWSKQADGRRVVAIVNATDKPADLATTLPAMGAGHVTDFESSEVVTLQGGQLRLAMQPWQVRLVQYDVGNPN